MQRNLQRSLSKSIDVWFSSQKTTIAEKVDGLLQEH